MRVTVGHRKGQTVRKRSKYRPKGIIMNPIAYVMESMTPVAKHDNFLIDLKIKNHSAMATLTQGKATRQDIDVLIPMGNICEALFRITPEEFKGFLKGNMIKYAMRQGKKDSPDAGKYWHYKQKYDEFVEQHG